MRSSTRTALIVLIVCAAALAIWFARPSHMSDSDQINAQIQTAVRGAQRRSIGAVMSVVSTSYTDDNDMNADRLRFVLGRAYRGATNDIYVSMTQPIITVKGDTAQSDSTLTIRDAGPSGQVYYSHPVHLEWHKEKGFQYVIFPSTTWRVTKASYGPLFSDMP